MNTFDAVYARRAVKHFDKAHSLTEAEEQKLLEATIQARQASTSSTGVS